MPLPIIDPMMIIVASSSFSWGRPLSDWVMERDCGVNGNGLTMRNVNAYTSFLAWSCQFISGATDGAPSLRALSELRSG